MIGIDFDNTIVCYDDLFQATAAEWGILPAGPIPTKEELRDGLRQEGRNDVWTELQGHVYGPGMSAAAPFPGVLEFLERCAQSGRPVAIVSHRTRYPALGPRHDLHAFAWDWLREQGITGPSSIGLPEEQIHFEETRADKLHRIATCGCIVFIDDLPEVLTETEFPDGVERIVFDRHRSPAALATGLPRLEDWNEADVLLEGVPR